jgi:uncharacterized protein
MDARLVEFAPVCFCSAIVLAQDVLEHVDAQTAGLVAGVVADAPVVFVVVTVIVLAIFVRVRRAVSVVMEATHPNLRSTPQTLQRLARLTRGRARLGEMVILQADDPIAVAVTVAIQGGDVEGLRALLAGDPDLATASIADEAKRGNAHTRTLLHVVTDWPGHFPNGAESVAVLVEAGADVNARFTGPHTETPLHWAASSDDLAVLVALLDAGADIEARGAVIGGGTPMADATAFGQWNAARRLLERGAATTLWEAAALGLLDRVESHFVNEPMPPAEEVTAVFWGACHGGHLRVAQYLYARGADRNWIGWDHLTPLDVARRSEAADVVAWLLSLR